MKIKRADINCKFSINPFGLMFSAVSNIKPDFVIQDNPLNRGARLSICRNQQGSGHLIVLGHSTAKLLDLKLAENEPKELKMDLPLDIQPGTYIVVLHQKGHRVSRQLIIRQE
ncbi:MAG: hypothetical protein Roseis2KO_39340 [Roseivirga sp.]